MISGRIVNGWNGCCCWLRYLREYILLICRIVNMGMRGEKKRINISMRWATGMLLPSRQHSFTVNNIKNIFNQFRNCEAHQLHRTFPTRNKWFNKIIWIVHKQYGDRIGAAHRAMNQITMRTQYIKLPSAEVSSVWAHRGRFEVLYTQSITCYTTLAIMF